jgi:membrane-bound inhibitor of C-type lysozyme
VRIDATGVLRAGALKHARRDREEAAMRGSLWWMLSSAALLASACATPAPPPLATAPAGARVAVYLCDDGRIVRAAYKDQRAWLEIGGRSHALETALSGSGARYVGDGLQWWTKGPEHGRLSRLAAGEAIAVDPGVACEVKPGG